MTTLTIHLEDAKSEQAIKAVLDALNVKYVESQTEVHYDKHVIAGVEKGLADVENGRVHTYKGLHAILKR